MGVFKNEVGRPSNETLLVRNILKGILIVIVAAGIFVSGYYLNGNQKKEIKKKDAGTIAKEVYKYYSDFTYAPPLDEFYTENGALQKNLPENYMLTIATSNLKERKCKGKYEGVKDNCYNATEIKNMVDKLFGYKVTFNKDTSISVNCNGYSYSPKNNEFYMGGGLGTTEEFVKAMYDYKLEGNKLYIYEVVGEYGFAANQYMLASGEEVDGELTKDYLLKNKDLFNKYKWTFEKNSKGNYIYKNVEEVDDGKKVTTTKTSDVEDVSDRVSVSTSKVLGQNCYLELNNSGSLTMKVRSFDKNGGEYIDVKVNGINEKIAKIAVFALSNDASETFAAISENGNLYLARFSDARTEINFEKQFTNKKVVDLEVVTDSADELKEYYDKGYVIYENDSNKHEIITGFYDNAVKVKFIIK